MTGLTVATCVLALALAACLLWAASERTRRLAAEQSARSLADRVDALSTIRDRLLTSESGLRRDLAAARNEVMLATHRARLQEAPHAEVVAEVDAAGRAALARQSGGGVGG